LNVTALQSSPRKDDKFKYEIKDKNVAPYMGYDLKKVNELDRRCELCGIAGHFAIQCNQFKVLTESQKLNAVNERKLCTNCILSSDHRASECDKKLGCGFRIKNTRCHQKHHIVLHNILNSIQRSNPRPKRNSTNYNTQRGQSIMNKKKSDYDNAAQTMKVTQTNVPQAQASTSTKPVFTDGVGFHAYAPRTYDLVLGIR
jgi:hypothetical protein